MQNKLINEKRGQVILETSLVVIIIILLLGGILNIWLWGNRQIVERQMHYKATRVAAGTSTDNYAKGFVGWGYTPPELTEDMVLKGQ